MSKITVPESDLILIKKYYEEDNKKSIRDSKVIK